jgi:hypothetical protein
MRIFMHLRFNESLREKRREIVFPWPLKVRHRQSKVILFVFEASQALTR